ncbi:MAG: hypothetical protein AAFQ63_06185 [Cyanobacteria bacterium J06621_11]
MDWRLYQRWLKAIVLPALIAVLILAAPAFSWAAGASSNQALNQAASLLAPEPDAKISVYLQPEANDDQAGYGVNGDSVTVLEQVSDNQSLIWKHIRFDNSPYAEGWVQATFITLEAANAQEPNAQEPNAQEPNAQEPNAQKQQAQKQQAQKQQAQRQQALTNSSTTSAAGGRYLGNRQSQSSQSAQTSQQLQSNQRSQSYSQQNQN